MPLSDWRDDDLRAGNPDGFETASDPAGLKAAIASGEGFDWYYASEADRAARIRTPISDGLAGKPWVFRFKDLEGWWANPHHERRDGREEAAPTAWVPKSKPLWFTEIGCPAVDKGPNRPNAFPDPKSVENAIPYFSNGGRCDLARQRYLDAHARHWNRTTRVRKQSARAALRRQDGGPGAHLSLGVGCKALSGLSIAQGCLSDGDNWSRGHWLNGRLGNPSVAALIDAILADHGLPPADTIRGRRTGQGYVIADPTSARAALEPLVELFDIAVHEEADRLVFRESCKAQWRAARNHRVRL